MFPADEKQVEPTALEPCVGAAMTDNGSYIAVNCSQTLDGHICKSGLFPVDQEIVCTLNGDLERLEGRVWCPICLLFSKSQFNVLILFLI